MFNFFKRKDKVALPELTKLPVDTDIHSHILAGIDDGSPDIATSLKLVQGIIDLGIRKTIATPHIIGDMYRNTPQTINDALQKLQLACKEAGMDIEIQAAAEYMLDDYFVQLLQSDEPLLTISKNIILTEQSYASPTSNLHEISFDIMTKGYKPIMAHPERYFFYHDDYEEFNTLKDMGFYLQVNLLSLTGYYGKPVAKAARYLFDKDLVDFVGTDMHHQRHLDTLTSKQNIKLFDKYLSKKQFNILP